MVPLIPAGRSEMGYRSVREISFGSGFDLPRVQSGPICARSSTPRPSERVPVVDGTEPQFLGPVRVGFCLTEWRSGAIIRIDENCRFPACRCYAPWSAPTAPAAERFGLGSRGRRGGGGALPVARSVPVPLESGRVRRMSGRDSPRDRLDGRERDGGLLDRERLAARRLRLHIPHPDLRRQRRLSAPLRPGPFRRARDSEREPPESAVRCHPDRFEWLRGRDLELDHVERGPSTGRGQCGTPDSTSGPIGANESFVLTPAFVGGLPFFEPGGQFLVLATGGGYSGEVTSGLG
jgi:hypothetical protein